MSLKDIIQKFPKSALGLLLGTVGLGGGVAGANLDGLKDILLNHGHSELQAEVRELRAEVAEFKSMNTIPAVVPTVPASSVAYDKALLDVVAHIDSKVLYTCKGDVN